MLKQTVLATCVKDGTGPLVLVDVITGSILAHTLQSAFFLNKIQLHYFFHPLPFSLWTASVIV